MSDKADVSTSLSRSPLRMQSLQSDGDVRTKENHVGRFNSPLRAKPGTSPKRPFGAVLSVSNLSNSMTSSTSISGSSVFSNVKQTTTTPTSTVSSSTMRHSGVTDGKSAIKAFLSPKPTSTPTSSQDLSPSVPSYTVVFPPGPCGLELEPNIAVGNRQIGCKIKDYHIAPNHSGIDPRVLSRAVSIGDVITHVDAHEVVTTKFFSILEILRDSKDRLRTLTFKRSNSMAKSALVSLVQESRLATPTMAPPLTTTRSAIIEQIFHPNSSSKMQETGEDGNRSYIAAAGYDEESDEIEQGDLEEVEEGQQETSFEPAALSYSADASAPVSANPIPSPVPTSLQSCRNRGMEAAQWREYLSPSFSPRKIRDIAASKSRPGTGSGTPVATPAQVQAPPPTGKKSLSHTPLGDDSSAEGNSISVMEGEEEEYDDNGDDADSYLGSPIESCKMPVIGKDLGRVLGTIGSGIMKASTAIGAAVAGQAYGSLLPKYSNADMEKVMLLKHSLLSELSTSCMELGKLEEELQAARGNEARLMEICSSEQDRIFELEAEVGRLRTEKVVVDSKLRIVSGERESSSENNRNYLHEIDEWKKMVGELQKRLKGSADEYVRLEQEQRAQVAQVLEESSARRREFDSVSAQLHSLVQVSHEQTKLRDDAQAQLSSALSRLAVSERERALAEARLELLQESAESDAKQREKGILLVRENYSAQCDIFKGSCERKDAELAALREEMNELSTVAREAERRALSQAAACSELSSEVSAASLITASYQSEIRDLKSRLDEERSSVASLRAFRDDANDTTTSMTDQLKAMEQAKGALRDEIVALNEHIERYESENSYKKCERIELLRQVEFEKTANESLLHDLNFAQEAFLSLEEELAAYKATCRELECEIDNLEHIVSIKDEDICRKRSEISSLLSRSGEAEKEVDRLAGAVELLSAERADLAAASDGSMLRVSALEEAAGDRERELEQVYSNLAESTKTELVLRSKIDQLSCVVSGLELQVASYSDKVSITEDLQVKATLEWQQKLNALLAKHAEREAGFSRTLAAAEEAHRSEVEELEGQVSTSNEVIAAIQKEFNIFRHNYGDKERENLSLQEMKESYSQRLNCLASDLPLLQAELDEMRAELSRRDCIISRLETENDNASLRRDFESSCKRMDELADENRTLNESLDDITAKSLAYTRELTLQKADAEAQLCSTLNELAAKDVCLKGGASAHIDKVFQLKKELEYLRTDVLVAVNIQNAMHNEYCKNESNFKVQIETAESITATLEAKLADMTKRQQAALQRAEVAERNVVDTEQRCVASLGRTVALEQSLNDCKDELVVMKMQLNESHRTMTHSQNVLISRLRALETENAECEESMRALETRLAKSASDSQNDMAALQREYDETLEACRQDRARVISSYEARLLEKTREYDFTLQSMRLEHDEKIDTLTFLHKQELQSTMQLEDESKRIVRDELVSSRLSDELHRERRLVERLNMEKDMLASKHAAVENREANAIKAYEEQAAAAVKLAASLKEKQQEAALLTELKDITEQNYLRLDQEVTLLTKELAAFRASSAAAVVRDDSRCDALEEEVLALQQALRARDNRIEQLRETTAKQLADASAIVPPPPPPVCLDMSTCTFDDSIYPARVDVESQTPGDNHSEEAALGHIRADMASLQQRSDEMLAAMLAQTSVLMDAEKREAEYKANRFSLEQYALDMERRLQSTIESSTTNEQNIAARHQAVVSQLQEAVSAMSSRLAASEDAAHAAAQQLAAKSEELSALSAHVQELLSSSYTPMKPKQAAARHTVVPAEADSSNPPSDNKSKPDARRFDSRLLREMAIHRSDYCPEDMVSSEPASVTADFAPKLEAWHDQLVFLSLELHQSLRGIAATDGASGAGNTVHLLYRTVMSAPWFPCNTETPSIGVSDRGSCSDSDSAFNDENSEPIHNPLGTLLKGDVASSSNIGGSNNSSSMALAVEDSDSVRLSINPSVDPHSSHAEDEAEGLHDSESFWNVSSDSSELMLDRSTDGIE